MFKHILAATDGSALGDKALASAVELARSCGIATRVSALMVVPDYGSLDVIGVVMTDGPSLDTLRRQTAEAAQRRLEQALRTHGGQGRIEPHVAVGDFPYEQIVATAERLQCDLIVMAARGRGALKSALLGSQTAHVLSLAKVPVLVVR